MGKEMQGVEGDTGWKKAIPEARDRLQSRVLVWVVGGCWCGCLGTHFAPRRDSAYEFPVFVMEVFVLSVAFALIARRLRAATVGGAACGGMICFLMTFWTGAWTKSVMRSGLTPLLLLFLLTFFATRAGKKRKISAGLAEARRGRSAAQVIANLSIAGICASPWSAWIVSGETSLVTGWAIFGMKIGCLGALVEATADTVSSEIGQAFGGDPVIINAAPGESGHRWCDDIVGSCAGVAAGALVATAGGWAMHLSARAMLTALGAGICGLFFDSLLGATVERRGWMGNDLVNFTSTLFSAALAAVVYRFFVF